MNITYCIPLPDIFDFTLLCFLFNTIFMFYDILNTLSFLIAPSVVAAYFIQFAFGVSAAAALTAGTYTEFVYEPINNASENAPMDVMSRRVAAGTNAWARCMCPGKNTSEIDFYFGLHEYEG